MARIRIEHLTKYHRTQAALDDFSLTVESGECCAILGPSGSGKTTLMNMVIGAAPQTSGEIFIDDVAISGLPSYAREVGMMFQGYALFPHMTAFENVAFPLRARGVRDHELRERVTQMLKVVELDQLSNRHPGELSGGQQQRVALARALVFGPRLLLMDEPLAALDKRLRDRMLSELRTIQKKLRITLLYITHDQQEAMTLADRIVVMNKGKIEQVGRPLEIYHRPRTRFVCEFLGESNFFNATVIEAGNGKVSCRTASGFKITAASETAAAIGQDVCVAVRPEQLKRVPAGAVTPNSLRARCIDLVDLGFSRRYRAIADDGAQALLFTEPGDAPASCDDKDDGIDLAFDPQDAILLVD